MRKLGFNAARVFLHDLLWHNRSTFLFQIDRFLTIAQREGIGIVLVLFDGCWDPHPHLGEQAPPVPHVHNSRWVQSPGAAILQNASRHAALRSYVYGVVHQYRNDARVVAWDVFNEPDNGNMNSYGSGGPAHSAFKELEPMAKAKAARALLLQAIPWVRAAAPSQPLTVGVYSAETGDAAADAYRHETGEMVLEMVDVPSFHEYGDVFAARTRVANLSALRRGLICTEYMARSTGSTFEPLLGYLRSEGVWAFHWGFVAGRSQTQYPWDSWNLEYTAEPPLWHHDVLRPDGTPFDAREAAYLKDQPAFGGVTVGTHLASARRRMVSVVVEAVSREAPPQVPLLLPLLVGAVVLVLVLRLRRRWPLGVALGLGPSAARRAQ
jgi:hypothetical protein